ncbi:uncharacterized protein LOC122265027 [Penaeus japonicus]|uniref:uncharacterized protein LOC122265027 n=1 Tax=Penaeus japonicus TaxID=27405 RepID=UPI001C70D632|nr:uncharacterized protein LOC122265027 [Penaeus japonicus]
MKSGRLFVAFLCMSCMAIAESTFLAAGASAGAAAVGVAAVIGGLAALKGAAILGFAVGRSLSGRRFRRSTETEAEEDENLLLSTVGQLDPNGCILKLLCLLQTKDQSTLTLEEDLLLGMFANGTETLTSSSFYSAAFVYATEIGTRTRDPSVCKKFFPRCPLQDDQLAGLLQWAWGCGPNLVSEEERLW